MYSTTKFIYTLHSIFSTFEHLLCVNNYTVYQGCSVVLGFKYNHSNDYVFPITVNALKERECSEDV